MRLTSTQHISTRAWTITLLIALAFLGMEYALKLEAERTFGNEVSSWLDLGLFLCTYLFVFCLKPIQVIVQRKLCRRAADRAHRKTAS
jgi:hypothetical protein